MTRKDNSILFAIYKNGEFQGWRMDTFGTLGKDWGKIYGYSREQIDIVLANIKSSLKSPSESGIGKLLGSNIIADAEEKIYKEMTDKKAFEVRVLKGPKPIYEKNFNVETAQYEQDIFPSYNGEELRKIFSNPDSQEVLETHYFSLDSQLNMC